MAEHDWLAQRFEENRAHLRAVAYRMLGSTGEADDAVQEAWLRLSRSDTGDIENLKGWLTTVVSRVCLDALRSRTSRREEALDGPGVHVPEPVVGSAHGDDPEHEALVADGVGPALLVVLETLSPAERVAFVLHDVFGVPFAEIAPVVGRTPAAAKMLASRAPPGAGGEYLSRRRPRPQSGGRRSLLGRLARGRLRGAAFGARPRRRAPSRPRSRTGCRLEASPGCAGAVNRGPRGGGRGRHILGAGQGSKTGARRRSRGSRGGSGRAAACRIRLHDHGREDRRD